MRNLLTTVCLAAGLLAIGQTERASAQGGEEYIGQMIFVGQNWCPRGWIRTDGQLLAISSNDALFSLIGTIYGGDGRTTMGVPDFRGRAIMHTGTGPGLSPRRMGAKGGAERVTLNVNNLASHNHTAELKGTASAATVNAANAATFATAAGSAYAGRASLDAPLNAGSATVANTGSNQPISIMQPTLALTICMAEFGVYPSRH